MMRDPKSTRIAGRSGENGAVTSFSVAAAAGVSQSTVSLVMSGKAAGRVSEATRVLVEQTARRLGYRPNVSAQMLRTGVLKVLALAVPNVQQPFFGQVLVAAELAARKNDHAVLLIDTANDALWMDRLIGMIRGRLVAGCIVYAGDEAAGQGLREVRDRILFVEAEDARKSGVDLDVGAAMKSVVEHLAGLGHSRIGYFAADYPKAIFRRRFASFIAELGQAGLAFDARWRTASTFELDRATMAAEELLSVREISALVCDDDLLAGAAYRAARKIGLGIPTHLSVVGFNDVELARMLSPELTTVAIPAELVARTSVERLLGQLGSGSSRRQKPHIVQLALRVRASTGKPPEGMEQV